jgi:SAM-dependent methyltransferase
MSRITTWIDKTFYPDFKDSWDNFIFREKALKFIKSDTTILDAGAGRGSLPQMNFKVLVKKAIGVDPSEAVKSNPFVHESHVGFCDNMPFLESCSIDVAVSNNVLEHVEYPEKFLAEINRVLKPEGYLIVKTPNKYHYMVLIAHFTPTWFHVFYNNLRGRPSEDTFRTQYKINSKSDLYRIAENTGFTVEEFQLIEGRPEYLRLFVPLYILGILYERIVNLLGLNQLKIVYFAVLKKKIKFESFTEKN